MPQEIDTKYPLMPHEEFIFSAATKKEDQMSIDTTVRVRVDTGLKRQVEDVLKASGGMSLSTVVRQLMERIARDGKLPFESEPIVETAKSDLVTPEMRHYAATRSRDHFGFSGIRAAMSILYVRSTSSHQINEAARALGSNQKYYLNMLAQAIEWGHDVWTWHDPVTGLRIYQLAYNPDHRGPGGVAPPSNWREMNVLKVPRGVTPTRYQPRRS